jgi:hypothetical protein
MLQISEGNFIRTDGGIVGKVARVVGDMGARVNRRQGLEGSNR